VDERESGSIRWTIGPDEVHLWVVFQKEADQPALVDRCRELLSEEEDLERARFRLEKHRTQYVLTRSLLRTVLSGYSGIDPRAWRFAAGQFGKPEINSPVTAEPLSFNLAHSDGLIVCACMTAGKIGVDTESIRHDETLLDIADRYFSPAEASALRAHAPSARLERFFYYWTLKESYIKAIGTGLSTPLGRFSFHIVPGHVSLSFDGFPDSGQNWSFWLLRPRRSHLVAVCAERMATKTRRIIVRRVVPPASIDLLNCEVLARSSLG